MKTINAVIFLPFLIIFLLVTPVFGSSDEWVELEKSKKGDVFSYNKGNIKHSIKGIVQVWCKHSFSDEGREEYIQKLIDRGVPTKLYDKLSHTLYLHEIDCREGMSRIVSITYYDTDGHVLDSFSSDEPDWSHIPPKTTRDTLRKKVCK